jgi:hypothetical protein
MFNPEDTTMAEADRAFTHLDFGKEVRLERHGREVRLIFIASTMGKADDVLEELLRQLKTGAVNITMMGTPNSVVEVSPPWLDGSGS